jgi:hypothetical protein
MLRSDEQEGEPEQRMTVGVNDRSEMTESEEDVATALDAPIRGCEERGGSRRPHWLLLHHMDGAASSGDSMNTSQCSRPQQVTRSTCKARSAKAQLEQRRES